MATPRSPPASAAGKSAKEDTLVTLPASLAEEFERTVPESRDRSLPLSQALNELSQISQVLSCSYELGKPANVRYAAEPFTATYPAPIRAERGDFEVSFSLPGFFNSTFSALLAKNRAAHRIYVQVLGTRVTVRVYRLPYATQANNLIAAIANEAERRGVRFLPFANLVQATDEELCAYQRIEPDFVFTPADVAPEETGGTLLDQFLGGVAAGKKDERIIFWAIQGNEDGSSAQVRVWVVATPPSSSSSTPAPSPPKQELQEKQQLVKIEPPKAPMPAAPETPIVVTARSLLVNNKKRRPDDETMTM